MARPLFGDSFTDVNEKYALGRRLGSGNFAKVVLGTCKSELPQWKLKVGDQVAIKVVKKPMSGHAMAERVAMLRAEVDILRSIRHPNIVQLFEVYETTTKLYLVMELLTGGELFDRIVGLGKCAPRVGVRRDERSIDRKDTKGVGWSGRGHWLQVARGEARPALRSLPPAPLPSTPPAPLPPAPLPPVPYASAVLGDSAEWSPSRHPRYSEEYARYFTFKLLNAVLYLHDRNICHRDLKPENILLATKVLLACSS